MRRLVVVGNGKAADVFLQQIRHYKHDFSITVFGGCMPHRRPAWYRNHGIDLRQEVLITAIDRHARVAKGSDGSRTTFDRLILATGSSGLIPPGLEARRGVLVNRSLETSDGHVYAIGDCPENRDATWVALWISRRDCWRSVWWASHWEWKCNSPSASSNCSHPRGALHPGQPGH
jgi:NAD(P)H-nitrite reductase large subunit